MGQIRSALVDYERCRRLQALQEYIPIGYRRPVYMQHMIAPVLLFSLFGKQGRVLEPYFDGKNLVLRRTKIYDFRNETSKALRDFAEWYLGNPTGDTTRLKKEYVLRPDA